MKRINEYKKLFGVENEVELKTLKKSYRNLVKEWHPDKFQNGDALQEEAEINRRLLMATIFLSVWHQKQKNQT